MFAPMDWMFAPMLTPARRRSEIVMKKIRLAYLGLLAALALLWLAADNVFDVPYAFRAFRSSMMNLTGVLAIGCMSVGIVLAVRPARVEPWLGGLDKSYRLHKWLGITALVVAIVHWLWAKGPKWLVALGWMQRPERKPPPGAGSLSTIEAFFRSQRGLAEQIGEWAFYAAVLLIFIALLKSFPYRHFFKTHRLIAIAYLALVYHAVVLIPVYYWREAIGPAVGLLMMGGVGASAVSLFRRIGRTRRAVGEIESLLLHEDNRVLGVVIDLKDRWFGHAAGQFAFVTFDPVEGPHPFTISSAWQGDGKLQFHIKGIGDYTQRLPQSLTVGELVTVEGPYGTFDFRSDKPRQIWVAGGIGITPFLARMRARAAHEDLRAVDLFYSTKLPDPAFIAWLEELAGRADVRLHLLVSGKDERLDADHLCERVPEWKYADVWFCGPAAFGRALRQGLVAKGLAPRDFHQELFDMR
ncbi:ferric reductase [Trinickia caryophylli]|uniref:Predicted ferric reductase n=3 Tax=Trinickia caryophylli TaxID=28094 RepID=A0A1X7FMT9_TRICW|nr:ferric reductase [Trinickia caryophylli]SMF55091.1 Predicted ferric reductase [Trinickia caryophylli]